MSESPNEPQQPARAPEPAGGRNGAILEVEDMHTYYGAIHALKGITMEVREGEIVTLIGANGAGKSTTLRSINGLNHPEKGDPLPWTGHHERRAAQGRGPGDLPVARGANTLRMTVLENLEMGTFQLKDRSTFKDDLDRVYTLFPRLAGGSRSMPAPSPEVSSRWSPWAGR